MGGIDSVGSASLRSFLNQPSNQPEAEWNQPAAAPTDTSYLANFTPAEKNTLKQYANDLQQNYLRVEKKGKDSGATENEIRVAVAKAALKYDQTQKLYAQNDSLASKAYQLFVSKANAEPVTLIVVGVIVLGAFLAGCSESGSDKIAPPRSGNNPDGGAPESDAGGLTNTGVIVTPYDGGTIEDCTKFPGGCVINLPTPNTLPDASTTNVVKPDAAPIVIPDAAPVIVPITLVDSGTPITPEIDGGVIEGDGGIIMPDGGIIMPDGSVVLPDTNYIVPVPLDGPVKVPQLPADARPANPIDTQAAPIDTQPSTPLTGKILLFSEHTFDLTFTGNAAAVQQAINAKPFTVTNTQGQMNCSANTQYYLVFWSQGNLVTDSSNTSLESYFPNVCKNNALNVARKSDISPSSTNKTSYPYGFQFPVVDEQGNQVERPPVVLTSVLSGATKLLDNSFDQGLPIGDKEAACAGQLASVPTMVLIPQNTYCPAGSLNLTVDKATFMADTSSAQLSSTLDPYWRQNIWLGVVEVKK
jgi:hypothetical protein